MSVNYPTLYRTEESSTIATFAKAGEARQMAVHFQRKEYESLICDLSEPDRSDVWFDPLRYVRSFQDVEELATQCIMGAIQKTVDDYWQRKAIPVVAALIDAVLLTKARPSLRSSRYR